MVTFKEKPKAVEHDKNLMLVYAVEGYSQRHNLPEKDVLALFKNTVFVN